jgi:hypothetical protein
MAKSLAFVAGLLLVAACSANDPTAPATDAALSDPSFLNNAKGCTTAGTRTAGTPGQARVAEACTKGRGQ